MALPSYYTPVQPYRQPQVAGQQVQNALYAQIAAGNTAAAPPTPPQLTPVKTSVDQAEGLYVGRGSLPGGTPVNASGTPATGPSLTAAAQQSSSNNGGNNGPGGVPSFEDDPILARTKAMWARNVAQAEAAALAGRKQAEIGYGYDPNYTYADQTTQQAAQQNAFSDLANLLYGHTERARSLDESLNKGNLFYSGERGVQLGREGRQYTLEQSVANQGFQSKLAAIGNALLQTRMAEQEAVLQAQENAYNRELQFELQYGIAPGGDGSGGGGGGGSQQSAWGGYQLPAGANSFTGAGQQAAPNVQTVSSRNQLDTSGGWGVEWSGPGTYVSVKKPGGPGQGSNTVWVKAP